jgi:glycosyltransferase involved in cell wall biosynthesis
MNNPHKSNTTCAVFSFYNTPSGLFKWWDEFPEQITKKLSNNDIDHHCFYRDYTVDSIYEKKQQAKVQANSWKWLFSLYKQVKKYDEVIFHTHSFYPPLKLFLFTLFHKNRHWIITEHRLGSTPAPTWKKNIRIILRYLKLSPAYIICVSDAVEKRNQQLYGAYTTRIYNGINLTRHKTEKTRTTPKRALYVGRLDPKKGIWNLLKAFKIIAEKHAHPQVELCVVGGGKELSQLQNYVTTNQLESLVTLAGYQENPASYYQQADFVIVPTLIKEAFPLVALEARSAGLPILYANDGGLPEAVAQAGAPLQGTSPQQIAESVINFTHDVEKYKKMVQSCSDNLDYFSLDRMTNEYVAFYEKLFTSIDKSPVGEALT